MLDKNIDLNKKRILVTGAAGFIGANLVMELVKRYPGSRIVGLDNMNPYYDVRIKNYRLDKIAELVTSDEQFELVRGDLADKDLVDKVFEEFKPQVVVNLAAQAGVRYSIENPDAYIQSNIIGFYNILEACRHSYDSTGNDDAIGNAADVNTDSEGGYGNDACSGKDGNALDNDARSGKNYDVGEDKYTGVEHLIYASSSSVYGSNKKIPYSVEDKVDNPVSLYAATKKSNELLAHSYSKLYGIPSTGLRFFTVYGPAGRPDMAYFGFTDKLLRGETIKIFNFGNCKRDFTYVDDIVEGVINVMGTAPAENENGVRYNLYNIGNNDPVNLLDFVDILQQELVSNGVLPEDYDFESHKELVPMQPGDVEVTYADVSALERDFGFRPSTPLREGLRSFAKWYKDFYM